MTREELFGQFPRPWRAASHPDQAGSIFDVDSKEILVVDHNRDCDDGEVQALAQLIVDVVNAAEPQS